MPLLPDKVHRIIEKVAKFEIKLGLPFMVSDLVNEFQMILTRMFFFHICTSCQMLDVHTWVKLNAPKTPSSGGVKRVIHVKIN